MHLRSQIESKEAQFTGQSLAVCGNRWEMLDWEW